MSAIHLCSFTSAIDDMKRKDQADIVKVLGVLDRQQRKQFSVFDATANMTIARTMTKLVHQGYLTTDNSCGYPWTAYTLTDKGRATLAASEQS